MITVRQEHTREFDEDAPADRIRLLSAANDRPSSLFHIRMLYGRLNARGDFQGALRSDGIIIGGPDYRALDTNDDHLIGERELYAMCAEVLGWDGELVEISSLPVEGPA
jgi:hypothetical protein